MTEDKRNIMFNQEVIKNLLNEQERRIANLEEFARKMHDIVIGDEKAEDAGGPEPEGWYEDNPAAHI